MLTLEELVSYLRKSVSIQDPQVVFEDSVYLKMTDEEITLFIKVVLTRDFPQVTSLDDLTGELVYPVTLLAKKELYFALASADAPLFDLGADDSSLKRSQRFEHYLKMIAEVDKEYDQYIKDGGAGSRNILTSFEVLRSDRYYTKRNYEKGFAPVLSLQLDRVTDTIVELSWEVSLSKFLNYKVYVSESQIFDPYKVDNKVSKDAKLLFTIQDVHQKRCRIEGLKPETFYHVLVVATDRSSLTGYKEITVTTLANEVG